MILDLPMTVNFGQMKFGQSYTKDYVIKNTSNTAIEILNLGRSCTCTDVSLDKSIVKSGEQAIIKITVTPGSTGIFSRSMWFNINSQHYNITLTGHAN